MNYRILKKLCKKVFLKYTDSNIAFDDNDGLYHYFYQCGGEFDEWDSMPAWEFYIQLQYSQCEGILKRISTVKLLRGFYK